MTIPLYNLPSASVADWNSFYLDPIKLFEAKWGYCMIGLIPLMSIERSSQLGCVTLLWQVVSSTSGPLIGRPASIPASDWLRLTCYDELVTVSHPTDGAWNNVSEEHGLTQNVINRAREVIRILASHWSAYSHAVLWLAECFPNNTVK